MGDCKPRLFVVPEVEPILPSSDLCPEIELPDTAASCMEIAAPVAPDCCENDAEERGFYNARIVLRCPVGSEGSRVVVEHGDFFSAVSQEAADALATASAEALLVCTWWNTEQTAECGDSTPDFGFHDFEDDPVTPLFYSTLGTGGWDSALSGDSNTTPAHVVSSTISQEAADELALQLAEDGLECESVLPPPMMVFSPSIGYGFDLVEPYPDGDLLFGLWAGAGWYTPGVISMLDFIRGRDSIETYPIGDSPLISAGSGWAANGSTTIYP